MRNTAFSAFPSEDKENDDGGRSAANGRNHKDIRQRFRRQQERYVLAQQGRDPGVGG